MATTTATVQRSRSIVRAYVALTKPSIISLLVFTALGGMVVAMGSGDALNPLPLPYPLLIAVVLGGGALAAAGANALNHYLDRDIDQMMRRTASRPVASGFVEPTRAMWFGIGLNVAAFAILWLLVNPLSAVLTLSATLFYVFVYTMWLKRSTPQNIVIGGAAGSIPPAVGWVAVTGSLDWPALFMFLIVFFWTPPHFWALSLLLKDDYAEAGVPMLPVVSGVAETKRSILLYTFVLTGITAAAALTHAFGWVYLIGALALGAGFIYYAFRLKRRRGIEGAKAAYLFSLAYLGLLFAVMMADSFVGF